MEAVVSKLALYYNAEGLAELKWQIPLLCLEQFDDLLYPMLL